MGKASKKKLLNEKARLKVKENAVIKSLQKREKARKKKIVKKLKPLQETARKHQSRIIKQKTHIENYKDLVKMHGDNVIKTGAFTLFIKKHVQAKLADCQENREYLWEITEPFRTNLDNMAKAGIVLKKECETQQKNFAKLEKQYEDLLGRFERTIDGELDEEMASRHILQEEQNTLPAVKNSTFLVSWKGTPIIPIGSPFAPTSSAVGTRTFVENTKKKRKK